MHLTGSRCTLLNLKVREKENCVRQVRAASGSYLISKMTKKRDDPSRRIILPPEVLCLMVHMGRGIQIQIQWNSFIIKHRPTPTFYSGDLGHEEARRGKGGEGRKII